MLLVRHAKAGHRRDWKGDDRERPLSHAGASQARKLVPVLSPLAPARLLSSPYTRCVQTLEPLAKPLRLKVEKLEELAEGKPGKAIAHLRSLADGPTVAVSTHGDIVQAVLEALIREDGLEPAGPLLWPKGSTWVLHADDGRFVKAEYLPAPA